MRRRLAGDLDDIVLMALRKEPDRRYPSVEQFSEDIRNHLAGLPVAARKGSWSYRAGKFMKRHKAGVAATALVILVVLGGVITTVREARIAAANQRRAEQRFNDVRTLANSLMFEIHDAIRDLPGSTPARRLLVTRAQEYLDSLSQQSKGDVSLQKELAAAYERVGDVLGYPYGANLGDKPGALQNYRKALAIRESLISTSTADPQLERDLVGNYIRLGQVLDFSGNFADAMDALRKALPIAQRIAAGGNDPILADHLAGSYYFIGASQIKTGNLTAALESYQQAATVHGAALQAHPDNFSLRTHLAADFAGIASCMAGNHDISNAIQMQSKAAAMLDELAKAHPENASLSEYLGEGTNRLGTYRNLHGEAAAALEAFRRAHQIFGDLTRADPKNSLAKSNFAFSNTGIAESLVKLHRPAAAVPVYRESIATFEEMSPRTTSNRYPRSGLADAYSGLGQAYSILAVEKNIPRDQKRQYWENAHSSCQKSLAIWSDKQKRGEMENGEREEPAKVAACIAGSEAELGRLGPR
jgi:eukaryotic-like serine/threonine-protein kinase